MILCCPHPDQTHDPAGDCAVIHCGCHRITAGVRCSCPYNDCWVLVSNPGDVCGACVSICVVANGMDNDRR